MSSVDFSNELKEWFDEACKVFERFSAIRVLSNDTQYDIVSLEKSFTAWYKKKTNKMPSQGLFNNEVSKRCRGREYGHEYNDEYRSDDDSLVDKATADYENSRW